MNKKAVEQLTEAVAALRANRFGSLEEAAIFCEAARATIDDQLCGVTEIGRATKLPYSTVSRLVWNLRQRGFLEYERDTVDRRIRRVRAMLDAFK